MRPFKILDKALEIATFIAFLGLVIVVTIQVITRFTPVSYIWSVELSRYLFIYSIALGAPIAIKRNEFVNIDFLINWVPKRIRPFYSSVLYVLIIFLTLIIGIYGINFIQIGSMQHSQTLPIFMSIPYASMSITAFLMTIYAAVYIYDLLKGRNQKGGEDQ